MGVAFDDLPFKTRPDLSPYLIHLTRGTELLGKSALDNLETILREGLVTASGAGGFVKGPNPAACFMDVPFGSLKYVLNKENADPADPRYEPYGIFVTKYYAYEKGMRPVLYLADKEVAELGLPTAQLWRVVRFEAIDKQNWISWIHEREWRCRGDFPLSPTEVGVLVRTSQEALSLQNKITRNPTSFKTIPRCVLPLRVICQGLDCEPAAGG